MQLSPTDHLAIDRELSKRGLAAFLKLGWPVLNPGDAYIHNWHMDAIAEHLEAVISGELTRLLINVPPGTSKSTACSVMLPAWIWGPGEKPHYRFIGCSHEATLATRDSRFTRNLVESEWFQARWPLGLAGDQNEKNYFETDHRGFRQASAVKAMTGRRGHVVVWDDPHTADASNREVAREDTIQVLRETLSTRLVDQKRSGIVIMMQRLHQSDVSGFVLDNEFGYEHLMLPMEFDPARKCYTSIGFEDPRTEEGELLFEERFPRETVDTLKRDLGSFAAAGQLQQLPTPREGLLIKREWFRIRPARPTRCTWVRAWDLAATDEEDNKNAAWTRGVLMGRTHEGEFCIGDVVGMQGSAGKVLNLMKQTAKADGRGIKGSFPQDPGQAGKAQARAYAKALAGYDYTFSPETGDKISRFQPFRAAMENGEVFLVKGPWNEAFIDELCDFPAGKFADQVDAASRAYAVLVETSGYNLDAWG